MGAAIIGPDSSVRAEERELEIDRTHLELANNSSREREREREKARERALKSNDRARVVVQIEILKNHKYLFPGSHTKRMENELQQSQHLGAEREKIIF